MASVFNRGTRERPNWYCKFKDPSGRWVMRPTQQPTKVLARRYADEIEARIAQGKVGIEAPRQAPLVGDLMTGWAASLSNRNAQDDRYRIERHLRPMFGTLRLPDVTLARVMAWIDESRAGTAPTKAVRERLRAERPTRLSEASIRHNLNALSRFFGWAIERGHATVNPVRQIPVGRRPQQAQKRDVPWLRDDGLVRLLVAALREPIGLMFFLGNRSGLRTGEIAGLRMADLDYLDEGVIRVRFSYDGPLKEDKRREGKCKWAPAPIDAETVLGAWLRRRETEGAGPEDLVFPCPTRDGGYYRKEFIEAAWEKAVEKIEADHEIEIGLTWYEATRHSFVSRNLSAGASLDEVSSAVGHASPSTTRRYYDHFVRRAFSDTLRTGLGAPPPGSPDNVVTLRTARRRRNRALGGSKALG